jgi:hypothetical protein
VSFIKPDSNGIMNIFVQQLPTGPQLASMDRTVSLLEQRAPTERQVTFDEKRGVSSYSWAEDDSTIFFLQVGFYWVALSGFEGFKVGGFESWVGLGFRGSACSMEWGVSRLEQRARTEQQVTFDAWHLKLFLGGG